MTSPDTQFSKARIEMICDAIFAIAMTLLVLDLKVPALPRHASSAAILVGLRELVPALLGFFLTFFLAAQFWVLHHVLFNYVNHADRPLTLLSLPFLMFVSLLPFSTSMLTTFGLRQPVGLLLYFGNQFMLAALLALQWLVARARGLLAPGDADLRRRQFELMIIGQPVAFALMMVLAIVAPARAMKVFPIVFVLVVIPARAFAWRQAKEPMSSAVPAPGPNGDPQP